MAACVARSRGAAALPGSCDVTLGHACSRGGGGGGAARRCTAVGMGVSPTLWLTHSPTWIAEQREFNHKPKRVGNPRCSGSRAICARNIVRPAHFYQRPCHALRTFFC